MSLVISINHQYQKATASGGFEPIMIDSPEKAKEVFSSSDWTPGIFRDGKRSNENFMESACIAIDIDNTTASRMSIDDFKAEFVDYEYWICTSRNHGKEKKNRHGNYPAADRFHAVFPLESTIKTPHEYTEFIEAMISHYPAIDKGAKDGARFFYGYDGTEVLYNQGRFYQKPIPKVSKLNHVNGEIQFDDDDKKKEIVFQKLIDSASAGAFTNRDDWIYCGMALKAEGYSFEQWMELSWDNERELLSENRNRWNGFKADKHSMGTLIHYAQVGDPGFKVRKYASPSNSVNGQDIKKAEVGSGARHFLAMPWERWYQPHVEVKEKKNPKTGEYFDVHIPKSTIENLEAMVGFYGITVKENLMKHSVEITIPGQDKSEGKEENAKLATIFSLCVLNGLSTANLDKFVISIAHRNAYHPVKDFLLSLEKWDGKDRIKDILSDVLEVVYFEGCEQLPSIVLRRWLISCVAAVMEKSYRGRGVLTFQGTQEMGKTSFFRSIIPQDHFDEWFKDGISIDPKDRDSIFKVLSHWVVELGEIEGMFRKEISALKAFITSDEDVLRLPYEPKMERYPRRTILCATVNDPNFLNDPTGSSRFWVLTTKKINYKHSIDCRQLWAQAFHYYNSGERWWLDGVEKDWLTISNANFYEIDAHMELIKIKYDLDQLKMAQCRKRTMLATEVCLELGLKVERRETRAIATALRSLNIEEGWCSNRSKGFVMPPLRTESQFSGTTYENRYGGE